MRKKKGRKVNLCIGFDAIVILFTIKNLVDFTESLVIVSINK